MLVVVPHHVELPRSEVLRKQQHHLQIQEQPAELVPLFQPQILGQMRLLDEGLGKVVILQRVVPEGGHDDVPLGRETGVVPLAAHLVVVSVWFSALLSLTLLGYLYLQ